jgi:hypothetical protein
MFKTPEKKEFPSSQTHTLADNRPITFDAKNMQMVSRKCTFHVKKLALRASSFNAILNLFGRFLSADPTAERWQSG